MSIPDDSTSAGAPLFQAQLPEMRAAANQIAGLASDYRSSFKPITGAVEGTVASNAGLPSFSMLAQFFAVALSAAIQKVADELDTQAVNVRQAAQQFEEEDLAQRQRVGTLHFDDRLLPSRGVA
ncbi:hypothetical protein [Plantactinospora endophytica]|uniref:ESX-1 secretion-associated protein n=1 Tax=Plantactinospora endophytica TaxID=673535 RepID=A0ABQ4E175_9ACTN|nr:hypothetical protein [Plantactinospora endophytica]GIG88460.1 hypothetical protein Pen02_33960 [Plantactinospora endophytica]